MYVHVGMRVEYCWCVYKRIVVLGLGMYIRPQYAPKRYFGWHFSHFRGWRQLVCSTSTTTTTTLAAELWWQPYSVHDLPPQKALWHLVPGTLAVPSLLSPYPYPSFLCPFFPSPSLPPSLSQSFLLSFLLFRPSPPSPIPLPSPPSLPLSLSHLHTQSDRTISEHRVRFLCFLGIAKDDRCKQLSNTLIL